MIQSLKLTVAFQEFSFFLSKVLTEMLYIDPTFNCFSRLRSIFTNLLLLLLAVAPNGSPIVEMPSTDIPVSVIRDLDELLASGLTLDDAVTNLRGSLVPPGREPYPFRPTQQNHC